MTSYEAVVLDLVKYINYDEWKYLNKETSENPEEGQKDLENMVSLMVYNLNDIQGVVLPTEETSS